MDETREGDNEQDRNKNGVVQFERESGTAAHTLHDSGVRRGHSTSADEKRH